MRLRRFYHSLILGAITVFLVFPIGRLMGSSSPAGVLKEKKYDQIKEIVSKNGYARVIVKLDVPEIEALTARSIDFKTGNAADTYIQQAYDTDLALDKAISRSRDSVLHRLNRDFYRVNRTYSTLPYVALSVTGRSLEKLRSIPEVLDVVEDQAFPLPPFQPAEEQSRTGDPDSPQLARSTEIVGADIAWGLGYGGEGWYVAILDTGLLTSHEMFQGKDIVEQCYSLGDDWYDRENGGCPNGKIEMAGPGSAAPYESRFGHGTHVAGIAAGNNQNDRFGVARDAGIIAIQVYSYFPYENDVLSWSSDQLKGLEFVYLLRTTYKIASANLSLGGGGYIDYCDSDHRKAAVDNLRAVGIATVVSSGNESKCNQVSAPACISTVVTVNATDKQDNDYIFGNWHDVMVDLLAPGAGISSADSFGNSSYGSRSGTSMAAPHVAGAWAIMRQFDEDLSLDEILLSLQETGTSISSSRCQEALPKTRINVGYALMTLMTLAPPKNIAGRQVSNKSLLMAEYINEITWEPHPLNENRDVAHYNIYVAEGSQLNLLAQVDQATFSYFHRGVEKRRDLTYALTSVDGEGQESLPAYYTLDFGYTQ